MGHTWLDGACNLIACRGSRLVGFVGGRFLGVGSDGLRDLVTDVLASARHHTLTQVDGRVLSEEHDGREVHEAMSANRRTQSQTC